MEDKESRKPSLEEPMELPPLPAYQTTGAECLSSSKPSTFAMASPTIVVLPTYDQSEKFVKGGVLLNHTGTTMESEEAETPSQTPSQKQDYPYCDGTFCEFVMFFIVSAMFSVVGFVFSFCFATSFAAQSGAIAGLGTAFITKPVFYEFYYKNYEHHWSGQWCSGYNANDVDATENCLRRTTFGIRLLLFSMGLIGLVLLYKGFSGYLRNGRSSKTNNN